MRTTRLFHINDKELLAVILALESSLVPRQASIDLATDSTVAFPCIKNWGFN